MLRLQLNPIRRKRMRQPLIFRVIIFLRSIFLVLTKISSITKQYLCTTKICPMKNHFFLFVILNLFVLKAEAQLPPLPPDTIPFIYDLIEEVDTVLFLEHVEHLQDYGTRECFSPQAVEAQNWLKEQFESYGMPVELQNFEVWGWDPSDNVIAIHEGVTNPSEYIILGAHYDSYTGGPLAPGADDNASGTAGVLEVARILTQYDFEKTLIFCAFSAEEYGLFGSEAYAQRCRQQGMNILGYINMDMIGYHFEGDELHSDMIAPPSAQELSNFYKATAGIYVPDFPIYDGSLTGGNSDHTSFNNNGYQGIFPFEDDQNHSPYIHTPMDTIGLSLNSPLLAMKLMQCALSALATVALPYTPTGTEGPPEKIRVEMFPNPASGQITLKTNHHGELLYEVFSFHGKRLLKGYLPGTTRVDIGDLCAGNYMVRISGPDVHLLKKLVIR